MLEFSFTSEGRFGKRHPPISMIIGIEIVYSKLKLNMNYRNYLCNLCLHVPADVRVGKGWKNIWKKKNISMKINFGNKNIISYLPSTLKYQEWYCLHNVTIICTYSDNSKWKEQAHTHSKFIYACLIRAPPPQDTNIF